VYSNKVNPMLANNIVSGIWNVFNDYIPDVWIHVDNNKSESSKGLGVSLWVESTTGVIISMDERYLSKEQLPEEFG